MQSATTSAGAAPARDLTNQNVQSRTTATTNNQTNDEENSQRSIAQLAYALWQNRGCPIGSPEEDWIEAENQVNRPAETGVGR